MQQFEGFWDQLYVQDGYASHISAGLCKAFYEVKLGSEPRTKTIRIVPVAALVASAVGVAPPVTITAT